MLDPERVADIMGGLKSLAFFPDEPEVILQLTRLACSMATSEEQVRWLVDRMTLTGLYTQWPGIGEVRGCFCSKYRPADGINAYSTVYLDGIPPEHPQLAAPTLPALPPGAKVTADAEFERKVEMLADIKDMNRPKDRKVDPITADRRRELEVLIAQEVEKRREARARGELEPTPEPEVK